MSNLEKELTHDGAVLRLTLNTPPANIMDAAMMTEIENALAEHGSDKKLKAIVFAAEGKHFSFGASVEEHTKERAPAMLKQFHCLFRKLAEVSVPTFAVVGGQCLGGAMELVSYCSWIFAGPKAKFGQPEISLAVLAPVASVLLPWRIGGKAIDICVSGRTITAEDALRCGLVEAVGEDPAALCTAFIEEHLLKKSASSLRFAERTVRLQLNQLLGPSLDEVERIYLQELMETPDANEGIASFMEKRAPEFGK